LTRSSSRSNRARAPGNAAQAGLPERSLAKSLAACPTCTSGDAPARSRQRGLCFPTSTHISCQTAAAQRAHPPTNSRGRVSARIASAKSKLRSRMPRRATSVEDFRADATRVARAVLVAPVRR